MVDLDKIVVDVSREKLPEWNAGSTEDPRLKLHYTDAKAWLERDDSATGLFDIIVMDIADPIEAGPGIALYTQEFYQLAKRKLNPGGVLVTQSGPGGLITHKECMTAIHVTKCRRKKGPPRTLQALSPRNGEVGHQVRVRERQRWPWRKRLLSSCRC